MFPAFAKVARREPLAGPMMSGGQINAAYDEHQTPGEVIERGRQSEIPSRPSRHVVAFFLSPIQHMGAEDFLIRSVRKAREIQTPRGRFFTDDPRRNVGIPPGVPIGTLVGDLSGVAPYGLE